MFFTVALKDYIEHLHEIYLLFGQLTVFAILKSIISYVIYSLFFAFSYIISFRWLWDWIELPSVVKHNYMVILDGRNIFDATLQMQCDRSFFPMLDNFSLNEKTIGTGFLNSFFFVLPLSVTAIINVRALLVNGIPAGLASAGGAILGQMLWFSCILFGLEWVVQPFLTFEPMTILVGSFILLNLVYNMAHKPDLALVNVRQEKKLISRFRLTFILAWLENACIYNYFGNLTVSSSPNILQTSDSAHWFLLSTFAYLFGLFLGCILWTVVLGWVTMQLYDIFISRFAHGLTLLDVNRRIHHTCSVVIAVFALVNVPYYGMDYLFSGPLGFLYNDSALETTAPKSFYEVPELGTDKILNMDMAVDPHPFDEPSSPSLVKYEQGTFDAEVDWQNRLNKRARLQERDRQQITLIKPFDPTSLTVPRYADPGLKDYYDPYKRQDALEDITRQVFRDDVYLNYKDKTTKKYIPAIKTHREFRERYYANPIYKFLLAMDTTAFNYDQPKKANLSVDEEYDLNRRRYILQNYLDMVADYKTYLTQDKRDFADKVYNQQFKGTLSLIRQFNAVEINFPDNEEENPFETKPGKWVEPKKKVLKYDQPLYNQYKNEHLGFLHEELSPTALKAAKSNQMVLVDTGPFYFGWDGNLRKLLVKGSRLPQPFDFGIDIEEKQTLLAPNSLEVSVEEKQKLAEKQSKQPKGLPKKFVFQSWTPALQIKDNERHLKLASLVATPDERDKLETALELKSEEAPSITKAGEKGNLRLRQVSTEYLVARLPQYDWYWKRRLMEFENRPYLELGNTLPPQLDGIAWPGVIDQRTGSVTK